MLTAAPSSTATKSFQRSCFIAEMNFPRLKLGAHVDPAPTLAAVRTSQLEGGRPVVAQGYAARESVPYRSQNRVRVGTCLPLRVSVSEAAAGLGISPPPWRNPLLDSAGHARATSRCGHLHAATTAAPRRRASATRRALARVVDATASILVREKVCERAKSGLPPNMSLHPHDIAPPPATDLSGIELRPLTTLASMVHCDDSHRQTPLACCISES